LTRSKYEANPSLTWVLFDPKGKKLNYLGFLGEVLQIQTQNKDG